MTTDQCEPWVPAKSAITKTTPTQRPPRWNVDALLEGQKDERYAGVRWGVAVALKKYLDERGGKITDPAGAYNYLEHHMVKSALPHFSHTQVCKEKPDTVLRPHSDAGEERTGHSEGPGDSSWEYEISGEMPVVRSGDAETGQERSAMRETSCSRGPCGEGRDGSGER